MKILFGAGINRLVTFEFGKHEIIIYNNWHWKPAHNYYGFFAIYRNEVFKRLKDLWV